jgi:LPXTG-site transpeptidase (sortase) family protein
MIVQGRHRRRRAGRSISSSTLLVASVLLTVPAVGALTADTALPSDRVESGGVTRFVEPRATTEHPADKPTERVETGRILIDAIGVSADVEAVGLAADGTLALPTDVDNVGWYSGSSRPGDRGPAVIVGHMDSVDGPAVFARLAELEVGDVVTVENGSGIALSFTVSTVTRHPKESFPTQAVYGPTPDAELHLITCGGRYDRDKGYPDNVVVLARAATD